LASSLILGYAGVHKYGTYKDDAIANIEFHEIDSWNLVGGTSEMFAKEVGFLPRGPSSLRAAKAIRAPPSS
jgi:hypothetical protein